MHARAANGRWLVRMEDLDRPRVVAGADSEILAALERYGLNWDGDVVYQSQRIELYETALRALRENDLVFDCACSRADLLRAASAPAASDPADGIYPGTCRDGLSPGRVPRSTRFRGAGDFVVRRADGVFAYQLAVVVDDEKQGVTHVVRGADLLSSTPRQIALQRALGYRTPLYTHLLLVVDASGAKIGKRDGALALPALDERRVIDTLHAALRHIGIEVERDRPAAMLEQAVRSLSSRA